MPSASIIVTCTLRVWSIIAQYLNMYGVWCLSMTMVSQVLLTLQANLSRVYNARIYTRYNGLKSLVFTTSLVANNVHSRMSRNKIHMLIHQCVMFSNYLGIIRSCFFFALYLSQTDTQSTSAMYSSNHCPYTNFSFCRPKIVTYSTDIVMLNKRA